MNKKYFNLLIVVLITFFFSSMTYSANIIKISKQTIGLVDDIAKGSAKYSVKHMELLMEMGSKIDDFMPLIKKYPLHEQRNILLEVLKQKNLIKSTEALSLKGKLANGQIRDIDLIAAIRNNSPVKQTLSVGEKTFGSARVLGKREFYNIAQNDLRAAGFSVIKEEELVKVGKQWRSRPDFVARKNGRTCIGEIKSPAEPPTSSSWRIAQKGDTKEFSVLRKKIVEMEEAGEISKAEGGWMIIVKGQVEDYARKMGNTWDIPSGMKNKGDKFYGALQVPSGEKKNAIKAFEKLKSSNMLDYKDLEIIEKGDSITFIWPLSIIL